MFSFNGRSSAGSVNPRTVPETPADQSPQGLDDTVANTQKQGGFAILVCRRGLPMGRRCRVAKPLVGNMCHISADADKEPSSADQRQVESSCATNQPVLKKKTRPCVKRTRVLPPSLNSTATVAIPKHKLTDVARIQQPVPPSLLQGSLPSPPEHVSASIKMDCAITNTRDSGDETWGESAPNDHPACNSVIMLQTKNAFADSLTLMYPGQMSGAAGQRKQDVDGRGNAFSVMMASAARQVQSPAKSQITSQAAPGSWTLPVIEFGLSCCHASLWFTHR